MDEIVARSVVSSATTTIGEVNHDNDEGEKSNPLTTEEIRTILSDGGHLGPWSSFATTPGLRVLSSPSTTTTTPNNNRQEQQQQLVVTIPIVHSLSNSHGSLHGGAIATMIDALTSALFLSVDRRPSVTVDLHVSYLSAAPIGSTIVADSRVDHVGRSMIFGSCRIYLLSKEDDDENNTNKNNSSSGDDDDECIMSTDKCASSSKNRRLVAIGSHTKKVIGPRIISFTAKKSSSSRRSPTTIGLPASKL